jgi:hypothetical protein
LREVRRDRPKNLEGVTGKQGPLIGTERPVLAPWSLSAGGSFLRLGAHSQAAGKARSGSV